MYIYIHPLQWSEVNDECEIFFIYRAVLRCAIIFFSFDFLSKN